MPDAGLPIAVLSPFPSEPGAPLDPSNVRRSLSRITSRAGLGKWHPHELCHSAAALLSASGVAIEQVADVFGHRDVRTTSSTYRRQVANSIGASATPNGGILWDCVMPGPTPTA